MGKQTVGNVTVSCEWTLQSDGTETISIMLPQGELLSSGNWRLQDRTVIVQTLSRAMILKTQRKTQPLLNPMESEWVCALKGDQLTLKSANSQELIVLSKAIGAAP